MPAIVYRAEIGVTASWDYISPQVESILGYSPEEFTSELWADRLHPEDRARVLREEQEALDERPGVPRASEYRLIARDGRIVWIRDEFVLVERDRGPRFYRGVMLDITARKTAEEALARSETRFRMILETTSEWIWTADPSGAISYSNPAIEALLGYKVNEVVGKSALDLLHPDDRRRAQSLLAEHAKSKRGWSGLTLAWRHKNGSARFLQSNAVPFVGSDGEFLGWTGADRDVTQQRKEEAAQAALRERLQQAEKLEAVGMFAAGAAHNFNNLLAIIENYARFVLDDLEDGDPKRDDMNEIIQAAKRSAKIVRELLAFSRAHQSTSEHVDLNELLTQLTPFLRTRLGNNIRFKLELAPDLGHTVVDRTQMEAIIVGLVDNSRDALDERGEVRITTTNVNSENGREPWRDSSNEFICLSVIDTGCGMTRQVRERIFQPFFTTKGPASREGLGLSSAYGAVGAWGGHFDVDSDPLRGTRIRVYLPRADDPAPTETRLPALAEPSAQIR